MSAATATRQTPARAQRHILVVKLADLGDAILTTPTLDALRRRWPDAVLDVLTTPQAAVAFHASGLVDAVHAVDVHRRAPGAAPNAIRRAIAVVGLVRRLRRTRYDAVALCHPLVTRRGAVKHAALVLSIGAPVRAGLVAPGSRRGWFLTHRAVDPGYDRAHIADAMLGVAAAIGAPSGAARLRFVPGDAAERAADGLLATDGRAAAHGRPSAAATGLSAVARDTGRLDGCTVAIHPGAGVYSPARRWSPERFAEVAQALAAAGARIVLVGTDGDGGADVRASGAPIDHDLTGATDVRTLAAVLQRCHLVVANDGGVAHLAAAVGTPVVAVFGPSNDVAWRPWPPDRPGAPSPHRVVALDVPCRPCFYVGHRLGRPAGCATRDCLRWLGADRVVAAAFDALAAAIPRPPTPSSPERREER
ncbi:MAG: glycosyltransferase family 9 protein [Ardenticatenales bacterium]|nr:glycosyltransferase family 9 protein [Ardenticatenales bacterium]